MKLANLRISARINLSFWILLVCIAASTLFSARQLAGDSAALAINLGVGTMLLCLALAWWVNRSVALPLQAATNVAKRMASGDLSERFETTARGELGELQRALQEMNERMFRIIAHVRSGTTAVATTSGIIASDNTALSSRTEAQASSLQQTASSMEELTATVRQNAQHAKEATELVASASDSAVRGGQVVDNVVDTMGAIKESSRKIVDIISVIDGIAFQTNILALNAAVEAARAGNEGRGFAVVASEVRSLAQRSAVAAKEIKALILDAVEKVDAGSRLADEAGTAMTAIVSNVSGVAGIMGEIAAASAEQSSGIDEISRAVVQIDGMTQRNAALVEKAMSTAAGLQEDAEDLARAVSTFQLGAREFGNADEAVAMVQAGVDFVRAHGGAALIEEVNKLSRGRFVDRDLYISVYSSGGQVAAHGANRRLWHADWKHFKDTDGKSFIVDMVAKARAQGRGWTDYKWLHPITKQTQVKSAYFEMCDDLVIACGFYKQ